MLEEAIQHNTEAVIKLTEAILANGSCAPVAKEKRPRRTKEQIAADKLASGEPEKTAPGLDLDTTPTGPEVTLEELKKNGHFLVACGAKQEGLEKARELIKSYKVTTLDEVKPEDYSKLNAQFIEETKNWGQKIEVNIAI